MKDTPLELLQGVLFGALFVFIVYKAVKYYLKNFKK